MSTIFSLVADVVSSAAALLLLLCGRFCPQFFFLADIAAKLSSLSELLSSPAKPLRGLPRRSMVFISSGVYGDVMKQ
jgi:hypothetical protein